MDTQITTWEMALEQETFTEVKEEIASGPFEPYYPDREHINWN